MTLTKNSTVYNVQDTFGDVEVNGNASLREDGGININFNTDNGGYLNYSKSSDGFVNFNSSFPEANNIIDYAQTLIAAIEQEFSNDQQQ